MDSESLTRSGSVGIFDSGIGGVSIARKIRELLPAEDILYVADSLHAPYGDKSNSYIFQRMRAVTEFLLARGAKAVVVACNTATTSAISELRSRYPVPIVGVEPGIKPAALSTSTGVIGVLATPRTLRNSSFVALAERYAREVRIEIQPCPDLVAQIEALNFSSDRVITLLKSYITPLLDKGVDTIVLGCTHYNHVTGLIADLAGENVSIINTETAVAKELVRRLSSGELLGSGDPHTGKEEFWTSGSLEAYRKQIEQLWGRGNEQVRLIP